MLEGEHSYQRRQENLVAGNNASSAPENQVTPKAQKNPWYIQHFIKLLIGFGLGGGAVAILLPWMLWLLCGMSSGSADQLRLHLLYVTGGIIAVLTLLQTNWKNQGDRLKIDADIKKNEQDAEKNERDHIRQVHAERRSRYTKAVEQLADEKAAVRLGGIYTLVGLVDEWLADDSLEQDEQQKEGQVIINNLCSYIRSPFTLALNAEMFEGDSEPDNYEEDFSKDQAAFHEEQDVRRTIFVEMSKRSSTFTKNDKGEIIETVPGPWSDFDFDFSRAPIFYPLNAITIEKGNFSSAKFYSNADFRRATFTQNANFGGAKFTQTADFSWAKFTQTANFRRATFTQTADFSWAKFTQTADFRGAKFAQNADFSGAKFAQNADFIRAKFAQNTDFGVAKFAQNARFSEAKFAQNARFRGAAFTQNADFSGAKFAQNADFSKATFTQTVNFGGATFTQTADFSKATFTQTVNFGRATFTQTADFSKATFIQDANFSWATFTQTTNFSEATFSASSPKFVETYEVLGMTFRARFATLPKNQRADSFTVSEGSFPILLGEAELDGLKHHIPVGTVLFDPSSGETSEPAKPLRNPNAKEEKPAE